LRHGAKEYKGGKEGEDCLFHIVKNIQTVKNKIKINTMTKLLILLAGKKKCFIKLCKK